MPIQLTTFDIDFTAAASAARMSLKAIEQGVLFFDSKIYEEHGHKIGKCTATLLETLQGFIAFMKTQKLTSSQVNEASSAMHRGLCAGSSKAPGHIKNLCSMVWGVLKRRNFELLCLNYSDNLKRNRDNNKGSDKTALRTCINQLQISNSESCKECGDVGLLVVCERCQYGWHFECAQPGGLEKNTLKLIRAWFCIDCVKSGSEFKYYKKRRTATEVPILPQASATASTATPTTTNTPSPATSSLSAQVTTDTTLAPPPLLPSPSTSSLSAQVAIAPVLRTAAVLSEKMSILSMKLMQVRTVTAQPNEQDYQNYLNDIERLLSKISQQLDADSARTSGADSSMIDAVQLRPIGIIVSGESLAVDAADSASVKTGIQALPSFCKQSLTLSVQSQSPQTEEFGKCVADNNVGSCEVFRVTTLAVDGSHPYDSIALKIDEEMFYVNNLSTSGNEKDHSVTITEPGKSANYVTFSSVSEQFLSWALARMPRDYGPAHFLSFEQNSMVKVDCGSNGNCFFHSCLYLLKVEVPDFTFKMEIRRNRKGSQREFNLSQATHVLLRQATCQHLRQHFAEIQFSGIPIVDMIKKQADSVQNLSDKDIIEKYCDHYEKVGVWVEKPVVVAFAHFCQLSLSIFHVSHAEPYPVSHPQPIHSLSQGSGLFCTEQHYEASIYICIRIHTFIRPHAHLLHRLLYPQAKYQIHEVE